MLFCPNLLQLSFVGGPSFRNEPITDPGFSLDVLLACLNLKLLAKLAHKNAQIFGLMSRLCSPNGRQKGVMCQHLSGMACQM